MKEPLGDEKRAYNAIKNLKENYGVFHKTCFHIHTPASHDYKLMSNWDHNNYKIASDEDIYRICIKRNVFPPYTPIEFFEPKEVFAGFNSRKEVLSFLLLAEELIAKNFEIVVVTDHHAIEGVSKLEVAIRNLYEMRKRSVYPEVILGIEISCADKNHVIGIFENSFSNRQEITKWLNDNLVNHVEGSFRTSLDVLEFINSIGGIGYIAHIDNSDIFKESFLSGAYKRKLFSDKVLNFIGLKDYNNRDYINLKIMNCRSTEIKFLLDNDAHDIESIDEKFFWIKGSKRNFSMVKEGLHDYDISVCFREENRANQFIKGIYIENRDDGFLSGENGKGDFCLVFSDALNCLIGGRGTGKSTVLQILEYVLSLRCESEELLDFICSHGNTWVLYDYHGDEYLIQMFMPVKENKDENILRCFGQNLENRYIYRYLFRKEDVEKHALKNYLKISKVIHQDNNLWLEPVTNKKETLKKFFDIRYSVNELVKTASGEEINKFLYKVLFENKTLAKPADVIRFRSVSGLRRLLLNIEDKLRQRQREVNKIIEPFNNNQKGILRIIYTPQKKVPSEPNLKQWLFGDNYDKGSFFNNYNITQGNVIEFLLALYDKVDIFKFLDMVVFNKVDKASKLVNLLDFAVELDQNLIDKGINGITPENVNDIIKFIFASLITDSNIYLVSEYLQKYVEDMEEFSLEFNINSKEVNPGKPLYKDVRKLSLGQKVVAMLSFILGYSEYSKDYRPLIIDQPEDNLDNQYIYKNLVKQLREVKEKRQVIIATHNATIVTNAKADQLCVMVSDNKHGWVKTTGYPGEKRMKDYIINYLEGGKDSFLHRLSVYEEALGIQVKAQEKT